jgi:glycosyltransferase involved in cell wall biosynthesis
MNCFNGEKYLRESIQSVVAQTYLNWEIIFIDNVSTDHSEEIVRSFHSDKIRYFKLEKQIPLGAARNVALEKASGEYIAFLDTDDLWVADKLQTQIDFFAENPDLQFVYSDFVIFTDKNNGEFRRWMKHFSRPKPSGKVFGQFLKVYPVNLQTVMLRSDLIRSTGELFDPSFKVAEEFDLFMRLFYNCRVGYIKRVLSKYRIHPQQESRQKIELYISECESVAEKLKRQFPKSVSEHSDAYRFYNAKVDYYRARHFMRMGDQRAALKMVSQHRSLGWQFRALDLMLRLPKTIFFAAHKYSGRYI